MSPMPFGFDGSGYEANEAAALSWLQESPMPFGFDGSGYYTCTMRTTDGWG